MDVNPSNDVVFGEAARLLRGAALDCARFEFRLFEQLWLGLQYIAQNEDAWTRRGVIVASRVVEALDESSDSAGVRAPQIDEETILTFRRRLVGGCHAWGQSWQSAQAFVGVFAHIVEPIIAQGFTPTRALLFDIWSAALLLLSSGPIGARDSIGERLTTIDALLETWWTQVDVADTDT